MESKRAFTLSEILSNYQIKLLHLRQGCGIFGYGENRRQRRMRKDAFLLTGVGDQCGYSGMTKVKGLHLGHVSINP